MLQQSILVILATFVNSLVGVTPSLGCGKPLPSQPHAGHSHNFDAWVQDPNLGEVNFYIDNFFHVIEAVRSVAVMSCYEFFHNMKLQMYNLNTLRFLYL